MHAWKLSYGAIGVLIVGFLVRTYLFAVNPIINPDGFLYVQQAKALYFGLFDQVLNCYKYLSPYSILIALVYRMLGDWVLTAQWINIFFGTLTIIPLYWLMKRFFQDPTACTAVLVYALLPAFVEASKWIIRGPFFWFFSVAGLYFFILNLEKSRVRWLLLSSICFALGAWARIEGSLFIIVSALFLLLMDRKDRLRNLSVFLSPYIAVVLAGVYAAYQSDIDSMALLKPERLLSRPMEFFSKYSMLREQLKALYDTPLVKSAPYFFPRVRNLVWLIALGTLIVQMAETLFYFFFITLIVGLTSWRSRLRQDIRIAYLAILSLLSLALLYSQIIYNWAMVSRFLSIFLFPAFIFIGAGIDRFVMSLSSRFRLRGNNGYVLMGVIIMALLLPKNLRANFLECKLLFRQIGGYIAAREDNDRVISVCGAFKRVRSIHFFINIDRPKAPCFDTKSILNRTNAKVLKQVVNRNYDYFIWDQKNWGGEGIESSMVDGKDHFIKIHEWPSDCFGKVILYEVTQ